MADQRAAAGEALAGRIGVAISDVALLEVALTHGSAATSARPSNERLEFLGDRVLGLVIAELLIERFPDAPEGELAPRLNALVRRETCAEVAREIGLGELIRFGKSEALSGGRRKVAILGDAMEALIAAVYLSEGLDAARAMVRRLWGDRPARIAGAAMDPKTTLQEWAQARGMPPPEYETVAQAGADHSPVFTVRARLESGETGEGQAPSKRGAQQAAAAALLRRVEAP